MRTVLIIMPQFAPSSHPQVHRGRFLADRLPEFGWRPVILTVEPRFLEECLDVEFMKAIPTGLEIIRTDALSAKWTRRIGIGDIGIRSFWHLWKAAEKVCAIRKIDLLLIPSPPWHTFLIGPLIKKKWGIPFVLDYMDPWVSSMGEDAPVWHKSYWFRRMAIWLEPHAVRHAAHIISVSDGTNIEIMRRYKFLKSDRFSSIPMGGEPRDFEYVRRHPRENNFFKKSLGTFNFVCMGAMLPKAYDTLGALFAAVKELRLKRPDLYKRIRIYFIGTTYAVNPKAGLVLPIASEMGLEGIVFEHPKRLPYFEFNALLLEADAILALGSSETHYTASKIYPCILAERPLIAIYHEASSVVEVMRRTNAGEIITFRADHPASHKLPEIQRAIVRVMDGNYTKLPIRWRAFEKYLARNTTKRHAEVFDRVLSQPHEI